MSRLIKARTNNSMRPVHRNSTTSKDGRRSDTPNIRPRIEGRVAQCINTTANHPIVSEDTLATLSAKKDLTLVRSKSNIELFFVEDVSSDLSDSWFVPSWVDVVSMVVKSLFNCW